MQVLAEILGRIAGEYTGSRGLANDLHAILYTHGFVFTLNSQGIRGSIKFDDK
jgi:hypothetical protein